MVELALAFPVLLLILFGTIDFARVFYSSLRVASAARAGAQYGSISRTRSYDLDGMRQAALKDGTNIAGLTATAAQECRCPEGSTISCTSGTCPSGFKTVYVRVTASAPFNSVVTYPGIPKNVTLTTRAMMRVR
jgi:Flp pilus assembly protein TadG